MGKKKGPAKPPPRKALEKREPPPPPAKPAGRPGGKKEIGNRQLRRLTSLSSLLILGLAATWGVLIRLFSIVRFESLIHGAPAPPRRAPGSQAGRLPDAASRARQSLTRTSTGGRRTWRCGTG